MAAESEIQHGKHEWTLDARLASLFALTFMRGAGAGLALAHRYSAYNTHEYALYVLDHLTGRVSMCRPVYGTP
jgi:hypothetical protein